MSMLADIGQELVAMLTGLGLFASVNMVVTGEEEYPAAHVWLVSDTYITDTPTVTRRLDWAVQITSYGEASLTSVAQLLDAVRDLFSGMRLPGHGHTLIAVPEIKIREHSAEKGATVYVATVRVQVFPKLFSLS